MPLARSVVTAAIGVVLLLPLLASASIPLAGESVSRPIRELAVGQYDQLVVADGAAHAWRLDELSIVEEYLTNPLIRERVRRDGVRIFEMPDGRGVSFNKNGSFRGLLEPYR